MKRIILIVLALCAFTSAAYAKVLDIQDLTTPKGIRVWLVEDHTLPVLALSFAFRSAAATDPVNKQGVSQLLSNTLDEGAGDIKAKEYQGLLRDNAIDLGFDSSRDYFSGDVRTLLRHQDTALKLLKLALMSPRFDAEAVERMKQANLSRIRSSLDDPSWIGARIMNDRIYEGHPYALNAGGTLAGMAALNAEDLRAARARHFGRDQLVVGIAGDIKKEDALRIVDQVFGDLPATVKKTAISESVMPAFGKPIFYYRNQPQTNLSMAWPGIDVHDPDYYAAVVMDYIFGGGGFSSRLMDEVREKHGLTYGIYSSMANLVHASRYMAGGSMLPKNVAPTIAMVKKIADDMLTTDVTADELQAAKDYLTGSMPLRFSSSTNISGALVSLQLNNRPVTALDDFNGKINAVTPADIKRAAARIFKTQPVIVLVGAKPDGLDVETVTTLPNVTGGK